MADLCPHPSTKALCRTVLATLYRYPFLIHGPNEPEVPFVLASPHSGRHYPDSFLAACLIGPPALRRSEDAYADVLFDRASQIAPMISALFPRVFLDANRSPGELDPEMFDDALKGTVTITPHVAAGFGVIPRIVREGVAINRYKLSPIDAEERLARLHRPYHLALAELMTWTRRRFGFAVLIDCHTMPGGAGLADIVLGDRCGTSVPKALADLVERSFRVEGFTVARNAPFAGGYCTALYARPQEGMFALQIEAHRPLYLNEDSVEPNAHFEAVRTRIGAALARLMTTDLSGIIPQPTLDMPFAAE